MPIDAELLFEHTSDGVVELDSHLRIVRANDQACRLLRRPEAQLVGTTALDFLAHPGKGTSPAEAKLVAALGSLIPIKFEAFLPGLFAWHSVLAVPRDGRLICFVQDITDRVRREQDEAVKAIVRNIIADLPIAIAITRGREHRFEVVNDVVRRLWPDRPLEGELVERVLPEAREQGFVDILDSVYLSGRRFEGPEMSLNWDPDGSGVLREAIFNVMYQPVFGSSGEVNGIVHIAIDVTDQVAERKAMARLASERAAVLNQLNEGVIITDADGKITFVNEAAKRLHGNAVLGVMPEGYTSAYQLLTEQGQPHPVPELPLARAVATNQPTADARWRIRRPDGSEIVAIGSARPVLDERGQRVACVLTMHEVLPRTGRV